ncbi:hypothetical protein D9M71_617710 [compost metagenome]
MLAGLGGRLFGASDQFLALLHGFDLGAQLVGQQTAFSQLGLRCFQCSGLHRSHAFSFQRGQFLASVLGSRHRGDVVLNGPLHHVDRIPGFGHFERQIAGHFGVGLHALELGQRLTADLQQLSAARARHRHHAGLGLFEFLL